MTIRSTTTGAGSVRANTADPDAHEQERVQGRIAAPTDARPGRETGPRDSVPFAHIWQLFGYSIIDDAGTNGGPTDRIWTDTASGSLQFLGLTSGRVRRQTHVIPAGDAHIDDHNRSISVGSLAATIRNAPCHNTDIPLTGDQERTVGTYYDNC